MKKPLLVLAALAATSAILPTDVDAGSGWKTFGSGVASGRGEFGSPSVSISSTTKQNPSGLRFVVSGTAQRRVDISWNIWCFDNQTYDSRFENGDLKARLPRTVDLSKKAAVNRWDNCQLDVFAYDIDASSITVKLQARY